MNWTPFDFAMFGGLLAVAGGLFAIAARGGSDPVYRLAAAWAVGAGFLLVWAILAVGALGAEGHPADLMYLGVLGAGLVGAALARLRPAGMAWALLTTALALGVVAGVALALGLHEAPGGSVAEILAVNGAFATLFVIAAGLFWLSARRIARRG